MQKAIQSEKKVEKKQIKTPKNQTKREDRSVGGKENAKPRRKSPRSEKGTRPKGKGDKSERGG